MEQSLMQRELDNMSDVAQRTDNQLRYADSQLHLHWHGTALNRVSCRLPTAFVCSKSDAAGSLTL